MERIAWAPRAPALRHNPYVTKAAGRAHAAI